MNRLIKATLKRGFEQNVLEAQLQELAVAKAVGAAFGAQNLPKWPTWEQVEGETRPEISEGMARLRKAALEE